MLDETRLLRLINAYFDQELDGEEKRELECMLLASAKAREIFLDQAEWHGLHRELALREGAHGLMNGFTITESNKIIPLSFTKKVLIGASLAACIAIGFWMTPFNHPTKRPLANNTPISRPLAEESESDSLENVALLSQALNVEWEPGSPSFNVGSALPKGWLRIRKGTLRLDFYSGARVLLEGPASLDLLSKDLARLENGKLTANVPPPAQGFTVLNEDLRVVDRGTEFGMNVTGPENREVHVFNGEVELQGAVPSTSENSLLQGRAISIRNGKWESITANRRTFVDPAQITRDTALETEARWESWRTSSADFRKIPGLLVYFDFEDLEPYGQIIANRSKSAAPGTYGTVIGCEHVPGRWASKAALGYAKTSDRVRFRVEGTTPSLTMMAWVRVDSLPLDHNSLMSMAPGQVGEVHWKLDKAGRLLLGIRADREITFAAWERLVSPPVVTERDFGGWMHFATVIDGENGVMKHFVNGGEVASVPMTRHPRIQLGMANLGNFDSGFPSQFADAPVRSFNGRIDEFALISRALTAEEIRTMK